MNERNPLKLRESACSPQRYVRRDTHDPDEQYLKIIKLDVLTFDGHLDPQALPDWLQNIDRYFTLYRLNEPRKVRFAVMKLTKLASQYRTNFMTMRASRAKQPIETWISIKDKLKGKYVTLLLCTTLG